jgi:hypothetical protein
MSLLGFDAPGRLALGQLSAFGTTLASSAGTYAVTGTPAAFGIFLSSATGSFAVTGVTASYSRDFEAWFPRPFDADNWIGSVIQGEAWTLKAPASAAWAVVPEQTETWTPAVIQPDPWTTE